MSQNSSSGGKAVVNALPGSRSPGGTQSFQIQLPPEFQPSMVVQQYFGPRSVCSNLVLKHPGTYNVGVTFNTPNVAGAGSQDPRSPPFPDSAWAQPSGMVQTPWQGRNMSSPGSKGGFDNGQSSSQGERSRGSQP